MAVARRCREKSAVNDDRRKQINFGPDPSYPSPSSRRLITKRSQLQTQTTAPKHLSRLFSPLLADRWPPLTLPQKAALIHLFTNMSSDSASTKPIEEIQGQPKAESPSTSHEGQTESKAPVEHDQPKLKTEDYDSDEFEIGQPPKPPGHLPRGKPTPSISGKPPGGGNGKPRPAPGGR
ncbi:hypothetical protein MIND_00160000 [Mycena indigotica]|uniref:Uncharacterized protein n=1 Tax=Mycena indigotica TaxID=2126181 RepID=A0A8H6WG35_9AGAR|nr:uncharacterized protein MIND_00160000 [Mycena indigotica]KAF7316412.1 hypothetical protein MIND_00160000 [Mycena indigotica]